MWVPDVYQGAPTTVTAFLSVASKSAGIAIALRVFHSALGQGPLAVDWTTIFAILAAFSMTLGNIVAIQQTNIKRMMGYSSVAQAGYLLVGMAVLPELGPGGVLFFMLSYAMTNLGAFFCIIALSEELNSDRIDDFAGAWQRAPWLAAALGFCLLSLTGLPPTAGFFAKLFIFGAGVQQGLLWLVLIGVVNTAISAYYYIGVVKTMFLRAPSDLRPIMVPMPLSVAIGLTTMFTFVLFVMAGPALTVAVVAAGSITR
jgi:NADH-quinone oxidoreductase subunit N